MKKAALALTGVLLAGSLFALTACGKDGGSVGKVDGNFKKEATAQEIQNALSSIDTENAFGTGDTVALQMLAELEVSTKADGNSNTIEMTLDYTLQGPKSVIGAAAPTAAEINPEFAWMDYAAAVLEQFVSKGSFNLTSKQTVSGQTVTSSIGANIYQDATSLYLDLNMNGVSQKGKISIADLLALIDESMKSESPDDGSNVDSDADSDAALPTDSDDTDVTESETDVNVAWSSMLLSSFKPYIDDSNGLKIKFEGDSQIILDAFAEAEMPIDASALKSSVFDIYLAFDENGLFTQLGVDLNIQVNADGTQMTVKGGMALKPYSGTVTLPLGIAIDPTYIPISLKDLAGGSSPIL